MLNSLRHRVILKRPTRTYEDGSFTTTFDESGHYEVWAGVQPLSARERAIYAQLGSEAETRIIMRPLPEFRDDTDTERTDWRVGVIGEDYEIVSVRDPDLRGRMLILETKRTQGD